MTKDFTFAEYQLLRSWPILAKAHMGICTPDDVMRHGLSELVSPVVFRKVVFYS